MAAWAIGVGHDQTRKKSAWRAQRWAGSERRNPLPLRRQVGLRGPQGQRIGLGPHLACCCRVLFAPCTGHEQCPGLLPGVAEHVGRIGQLRPVGSKARECRKRRAGLAERQGRGLQTRRSDRAGLGREILAGAGKQVVRGHPHVLEGDLGGARGLQRGQLERRADGQPGPVHGQGDEHLPAVVEKCTGHQDVSPLGRGHPRHGTVELIGSRLDLPGDQRLGAKPPGGRELGDSHRGESASFRDRTQPGTCRRPIARTGEPAHGGVMLREDEDRRQAAAGKLSIALNQERPRAGLAAELARQRPARRARVHELPPERLRPGSRQIGGPVLGGQALDQPRHPCLFVVVLGPWRQRCDRVAHGASGWENPVVSVRWLWSHRSRIDASPVLL